MATIHWVPLVEHDALYGHPYYHHHHNHHLHNHHHHPHLRYHLHHHYANRWRSIGCSDYGSTVRTYRQSKTSYFCTYNSSSSPRLTVVVQTTTSSSSSNNISTYHHHHMGITVIDRVLSTDDHISLDRLQLKDISHELAERRSFLYRNNSRDHQIIILPSSYCTSLLAAHLLHLY